MTIREKVIRYGLVSTIMQAITLVFIVGVIVLLVFLIFLLTGLAQESVGLMKNVNPDDVTAGWRVLFGAAGGFYGVLAVIFIVVMIIIMAGPLIVGIIALAYGIRTYKKRNTVDFKRMAKNDSIIKLVLNAVMVVMFLLSILSSAGTKAFTELLAEYVKVLILTLPPIVSVVLSILTLKNVNYIEELPEESGQSYIEYSVDNPSYFGQY